MKIPETLRLGLLLALMAATSATAQDEADADSDEIRRYTVEMIIFSYAQSVAGGSEIFVPDAPPSNLFDDVADSTPTAPEPAATPRRSYAIERLAESEFSMNDIYEHVRRLDVYKPLMHFGWTQQTPPEEDAAPRALSMFARPPAGLEGELTLYLSRYLHLNVDLTLQAPPGTQSPNSYGENAPLQYRIEEKGIFRNGELRYFDHPKFGVLAKITRFDEAQDDPLDEPELFDDGG